MMKPGFWASGAMLTWPSLTRVPIGNVPWVKRKVVIASTTAHGGGVFDEKATHVHGPPPSSVHLPRRDAAGPRRVGHAGVGHVILHRRCVAAGHRRWSKSPHGCGEFADRGDEDRSPNPCSPARPGGYNARG